MTTDVALLNSVRRMERDALVQVFEEYAPVLYSYVVRTCRDALIADNIVGDVFARLLEQLSSGKGPCTNLRSYLFQSAYNLLIDHIRYTNRRLPLDKSEMNFPKELTDSSDLDRNVLYEAVWEAIHHGLNDSQRQVIILRFMEGFSPRETAEILGMSENHVKVTQNRAIASLRKFLIRWMLV